MDRKKITGSFGMTSAPFPSRLHGTVRKRSLPVFRASVFAPPEADGGPCGTGAARGKGTTTLMKFLINKI